MARNMYDEVLAKTQKVSIAARIDARSLATVASYLMLKGIEPRNRSDLVSEAVEMAAGIIAGSGKGKQFELHSDAFEFLRGIGIPIDQGYDRRGPVRARQYDELYQAAREREEVERSAEKFKDIARKIWEPDYQPTSKEDILAHLEEQERRKGESHETTVSPSINRNEEIGKEQSGEAPTREELEEHLPPKAAKIPGNLKIRKDS